MKKRTYRLLALVLCSIMLLSGCAGTGSKNPPPAETDTAGTSAPDSGEAKKENYKIGFSIYFSGNTWRAISIASLNQEVAKHENVEFIMVDGQNDINKQVNDIENLIAQGVDAILVLAGSAQAVEPALTSARERGIKVVAFNMPLNDENSYDVYIGTNLVDKGERLGKWMAEKLGGKGKLVALGGTAGGTGTALFLEGANKAFENYPDIEIIAYKDTDYKEDIAKMVMSDMLLAYPQIDGILCDTGASATGAWKAMLAAGVPLVPVTGSDYNGMFRLYLDEHENNPLMDFAGIAEPTWQSREAFLTALRLLEGSEEEKLQYIYPDMLTGANAKDRYIADMPDSIMVDIDIPLEELKELVK